VAFGFAVAISGAKLPLREGPGAYEAANVAEAYEASGKTEPTRGIIVAWQAGRGVIRVGASVRDTLLAVTVTVKPSVTVR